MSLTQRLRVVLGLTLILWTISERIFWSFWRTADSFSDTFITVIVYFVATYIFCICLSYYKVRSVSGLLLTGAIYGWITEGVVAMTLFGAGGIPLPFSVAWTGLAWHMLISVYLILWLGYRYLKTSFVKSLLFAIALGLFWGLWSMTWFFETPPVVTSADNFGVHAVTMTIVLLIGYLLTRCKRAVFQTSRLERIIVLIPATLFFVFVTIPTVQIFVLLLIFLFMFTMWPLRRNKNLSSPQTLIIIELTSGVKWFNLIPFLITPLLAASLYQMMIVGDFPTFPVNYTVLVVTTILGFYVYYRAWRNEFRKLPYHLKKMEMEKGAE